MPTIIETDSDQDEIQSAQTGRHQHHITKKEGRRGDKRKRGSAITEALHNQEEMANYEKMPMRRNTLQEEKRTTRRRERRRHKINFCRQNVLVESP